MSVRLAFILLTVAVVLSQTQVKPSTCPTKCKCNGTTSVSCISCLEIYFRTYDAANQNCPCFGGFVEMEAIGSYCCPANCTTCTALGGCSSCRHTWQLSLTKSGMGVCVCRENYFYDGVECRCLSRIQPAHYYEVLSEDACYLCPPGCSCNIHGCIFCAANTSRVIYNVTDLRGQQMLVCSCRSPFKQSQQGTCVCPSGCTCTSSSILNCSSSSHRFRSTKSLTWECEHPYQDIHGICTCAEPYRMASDSDGTPAKCVCGSRIDHSNYYTNQQQQCIRCPVDCICYSTGCQWCNGPANRIQRFYVCPCMPPYREILGVCQCYTPYFLQGGMCLCLNLVFPTLYYGYIDQCKKCPNGCTCDETGCTSCKIGTLRLVESIDKVSVCARCISNSVMINDVCVCVDGSSPTADGNCGCINNLVIHYLNQSRQCSSCPYGCNCSSSRGCYYCPEAALRNITVDPLTNMSTCNCVNGAREGDVDAACYCVVSADPTNSSQCVCTLPYFMDSVTGRCLCMSIQQPSRYYIDLYTDECRYCPMGCNCDLGGCIACGANTQRYVYIDRDYSQCLCYQTVSLNNDSCSKCLPRQFFANGQCIYCWDCVDCNDFGQCVKCAAEMTLLANGTCLCNNPNLRNINGTCVCPKTLYLFNGTCKSCPPYCHFCQYYEGIGVYCTSCLPDVHRINTAWYSCICEPGYRDSPSGTKYYCCSEKCGDCNATGCISCIADTNRTLNENQECVCVGNMKEQNGTRVCACPFMYFPLDGSCQMCPLYCHGCFFQQSTQDIQCIACPENSSRIMTHDAVGNLYCYCSRGFQQTSPESWFCFPRHCLKQEPVCTACVGNRMPINNGTVCVCKPTYFEDGVGQCVSCNMLGCLNCESEHLCVLCDDANNYILTESSCKKIIEDSNFIYTQSHSGLYVQFKNQYSEDLDFVLVGVEGSLHQIRYNLTNSSTLHPPVNLKTLTGVLVPSNIISSRLSHPQDEVNSTLMGLTYELRKYVFPIRGSWYDSNDKGTYFSRGGSIYFRVERAYSNQHMNFDGRSYALITKVLTVMTLFVVLAMYLKGFKHNQTVFYLQTMAFLGFVVEDQRLSKTVFLYNLRYSYFMFGNALEDLIPESYIQESKGNFSYFAIDSNLFRIAGTPLVIAAIIGIVAGLLRILMWCYLFSRYRRHSRIMEIVKSTKKGLYRLVEFFYKTCMYPALYFSFVTLHNWKPRILIDQPRFGAVCLGIAIAICVAYSLVTLFQIWFQGISHIYKIENATEFMSCSVAGVILCLTVFTKLYLLLICLILFRGGTYIILRRTILRDFRSIEYIKVLTTLLEVLSVLLMLTDNTSLISAIVGVTVLCQLVHACSVVFLTSLQGTLQKRVPDQQIDRQEMKNTTEEETVVKDSTYQSPHSNFGTDI